MDTRGRAEKGGREQQNILLHRKPFFDEKGVTEVLFFAMIKQREGLRAGPMNDENGRRAMKLLEERIRRDGTIRGTEVLMVDRFLNHQMDIGLINEIGKEFQRLYGDCGVNKILTIEASGIGIACVVAQQFHVPVVFAKKTKTKNIAGDVYTSKVESYTHGRVYDIIVSKEFLGKGDKVLLIDDFLANGKALEGLAAVVEESGAELVGAGIVIEKGFQVGGDIIRSKGIRLESLAIVDSMDEKTSTIVFRGDEA